MGRWDYLVDRNRSYPSLAPTMATGLDRARALAALQAEAKSGTRIAYCGDPMLETVLVVRE